MVASVDEVLSKATGAVIDGDPVAGLRFCAEVRALSYGGVTLEPLALGVLRATEIRAAFESGDYQGALDSHASKERVTYQLPVSALVTTHSVLAECSERTGKAYDVLVHTRHAVAIAEPRDGLRTLQNACVLLARCGRFDLAYEPATRLLGNGVALGLPGAVSRGAAFLVESLRQRPSPSARGDLEATLQQLAARGAGPDMLAPIEEAIGAIAEPKGGDAEATRALWAELKRGRSLDTDAAIAAIAAGADLSARDDIGLLPLQRAAVYGKLKLVQRFVKAGADIQCRDASGFTPLQCAVNAGYAKVAKLLLRAGAHIESPGLFGQTALHRAIIEERSKLTRMLLQHGASVRRRDDQGATAFDLAAGTKLERVLMENAGMAGAPA